MRDTLRSCDRPWHVRAIPSPGRTAYYRITFWKRELFMHRELIRDGLLGILAGRYKEDPVQFVTLSKQTLDSAVAREAVAELRNEGYVEEQVRGVIRLTPRGYRAYRNEPLPYAYKN